MNLNITFIRALSVLFVIYFSTLSLLYLSSTGRLGSGELEGKPKK